MKALVGLAFWVMTAAASVATVISDVPLKQNWVKRGIILAPGFAGPASSKFLSAPSVVRLEDGRLRMYVWTADGTPPWLNGRQIIIAAESDATNPFQWKVVSEEPLVGPAPNVRTRDRGVGFPYVLPRDDGPWLMYFGTWWGDWNVKRELTNRLGLAVSHDKGLTWTVENEDVLPSGPAGSFDAGAIPSAGVVRRGKDDYLMWYTAAEKYLRFGEVNQGIMHIGAARSRDGIKWEKLDQPALLAREDAADPYEACLARPVVLQLNGVYHMWLGVYDMAPRVRPNESNSGAGSYRLEYARSTDGVTWTRYPDQPIFPLSPGQFDSTSQTYASVVDMGEQLWLFYTGDGLGNTGVGLATLNKDELRAEKPTSLDTAIQGYVDEKKLAGAVTLVAKDGRIVQLRAHGFQDVESGTTMRTDSIFRIYSMTKPVTSAALLMLFEQGRFQLDDPLEKYIAEFADVKVIGGAAPERKITIRDIFTHTGGISYGNSDHPVDVAYRKAGIDYGVQKLNVLVKKIAGMPLRQQPGAFWHYSYSHDIQAYLVEYFSGMPFDRYVQEKIFAPLGMKDTSFALPASKSNRLTSMYAPPGGFDGKTSFALEMVPGLTRIESASEGQYLKFGTYPAGGSGLLSTADDYFRFSQMLVNGGVLGKTRLLSAKTVALMTTAHVPAGFPGIPDMLKGSGYGLGVSVGPQGQFGWSGAASTHVIMDPRENVVAILLVQYRPALLSLRKQFQTLVYQDLSGLK